MLCVFFFFKQKTAYEMRISDWSSDVCSSDLVQAKRYADTIRPEHVEAFAQLCAAKSMPGLFIHTGRTGPSTRTLLNRHRHIQIISGDQLLALIRGEPVRVRGGLIWDSPFCPPARGHGSIPCRSEAHPSALQSLTRIPYAVFA